jgi:phosphoglycolate phosphatase-like HAD superfamily hydrolase
MIWDVDGTLFNTYPAITYALSKALNRMGKPVALNLIDGLVRQSFQYCVDTLCRRYKVDADLLLEQFAEVYRTISLQNQPPVDGAREVCEWIAAQGGKNVAVCYREDRDVRRLFEVHELADYFTGMHLVSTAVEDDSLKGIIRKYRLKSEETLVVGDRLVNIEAGRAAGCQTCQIGDEVLTGQVDLQVSNYSHLLNKLQMQKDEDICFARPVKSELDD